MSKYKYKAAALSDVGNEKPVNQDAYYLKMGGFDKEYFILAVVADGMGGVKEGELASRSLTAAFSNWFHNDLRNILEDCKRENVSIGDRLLEDWDKIISDVSLELNIYSRSQGYKEGKGPGSTLTCVFLYAGTYFLVNIGDSRIYRMHERELKQLTVDHSWAQEQLDAGVSVSEIEKDSRSNMLTRCIGCGLDDSPKGDYFAGEYSPGDIFLLCSDGLRRKLDDDSVKDILKDSSKNTREKCFEAVEGAKDAGECDNITAIIVETEEDEEKKDLIEKRFTMAESTYIESTGNVTEELTTR